MRGQPSFLFTGEACAAEALCVPVHGLTEWFLDPSPHFLTPSPVLSITLWTSIERPQCRILAKEKDQVTIISKFSNADPFLNARTIL